MHEMHKLDMFLIIKNNFYIFSGHGKRALGRKRDYTPIYWDHYFEHKHDVQVKENVSFLIKMKEKVLPCHILGNYQV